MEKGLVQQVVRAVRCVSWAPGWSRCYKDTSYTRTTKKVRYKFQCGVRGKIRGDRKGLPGSWYEIPTAIRSIKRALKKNNIPFENVLVFDDAIMIYQVFPLRLA